MYSVCSDHRKFIYELDRKLYKLPFKWVKIYEDGLLLRHFQACLNEENKAGYYEHVLGNFFPVKEEGIKEISIFDVYRLKQYNIYPCDNRVTYLDDTLQYIDTGYDPKIQKFQKIDIQETQ